ncbi:hypothetical protein V6N12_072375 [Hibiscus sabdariffa]|uniref:Uncharacterized protein n=1 Tax=Hibiscus sabdariffa TaxID=183260 RepID=A0ABR2FMF8_9ROSI
MRRQGQYVDSGGNAYASAQMQHMPAQRMELKSGQFQGQLEAFTPERDQPYQTPKSDSQWRWERDGSKGSNPMTPKMFNEGQGTDGSRTYFQGQRPDPNLSLEKQNAEHRSRPHDENMEVGYEQNLLPPTLEGLEKKFHEDIMKLAKEQNDAEDAENTRHREKINAINTQYQEQLTALRTRHSSRRDEFLRKESLVRQQQYQQAMMDYYPHSSMAPADTMPACNNPHGYGSVAGSAAVGDGHRGYNSDNFESYRERSRFLGGARDQGFEPRGSYQGGRAYDTGSRNLLGVRGPDGVLEALPFRAWIYRSDWREKRIAFEDNPTGEDQLFRVEWHTLNLKSPEISETLSTMPSDARNWGTAVSCRNRIYVLGGDCDGDSSCPDKRFNQIHAHNSVFYFDCDGEWKKAPPMLFPRGSPAAVAIGSKIYVFGAVSVTGHFAEVFDTEGLR